MTNIFRDRELVIKAVWYSFMVLSCVIGSRAHAQIALGNDVHVEAGTLFTMDSLVLLSSQAFDLPTATVLTMKHEAISGKSKPGIKKAYFLDEPLNFTGQVGIIYHPSQLNGNDESQLELATSPTDQNSLVTWSGSTRDLGLHYISNSVTNVDLKIITLSDEDAGLPVTLRSFRAEKYDQGVNIHWETSFEENSRLFEVQRSRDAKEWFMLARVKAAESSIVVNAYNYDDEKPVVGKNYYRLKMVDQDGSCTFSQVQAIHFDGHRLAVFPNPASDKLYIRIDQSEVMHMQIISAAGLVLENQRLMGEPYHPEISLFGLAPGTYFLKMHYRNGVSETVRFSKQR